MPSLTPPKPSHPPPPNWPAEIHYLTAPFYGGIPPGVVSLVKSKRSPPVHQPSQNVEIKFVTDSKHPAFGQRGLYAKKKLKQGELILWYTGHVHLDPEPDPKLREEREKSDYDLTLVSRLDSLLPLPTLCPPPSSSSASINPPPPTPPPPTTPFWTSLGLAVDASKCGNEARFVNDFRGVPPILSSASSSSKTTLPPLPSNSKKGSKPSSKQKAPPAPKSKPSAFFHSVRTTTLTVPAVLNPDKTTPSERAGKDGELRMGIFVLKEEGIAKGEEILISYGKSFWASRRGDIEEPEPIA